MSSRSCGRTSSAQGTAAIWATSAGILFRGSSSSQMNWVCLAPRTGSAYCGAERSVASLLMGLLSNNCSLLLLCYCRTSAVGIAMVRLCFAVAAGTADLILCTAGLGPAGLSWGTVPPERDCTVCRTTSGLAKPICLYTAPKRWVPLNSAWLLAELFVFPCSVFLLEGVLGRPDWSCTQAGQDWYN